MATEHAKAYLEYLDKESRLVGIVSTFALAAAAFAIEKPLSAANATAMADVWRYGAVYVSVGSALLLTAALLFYRQRSLLAYMAGKIALVLARNDLGVTDKVSRRRLLKLFAEVDGWSMWYFYQAGFVAVTAGMAALGVALLSTQVTMLQGPVASTSVSILLTAAAASVAYYRHLHLESKDAKRRRAARITAPGPPSDSRD